MTDVVRGAPGSWQYLLAWNGQRIDLDASMRILPADDRTAAELLAGERHGQLHWCPVPSDWRVWNGTNHQRDEQAAAEQLIADLARRSELALYAVHQQLSTEVASSMGGSDPAAVARAIEQAWKQWEPARKYMAGLNRSAGASSCLRYLATLCGTPESAFDEQHLDKVNLPNGLLDIATNELGPHNPEDMITYCLDVPWNPGAPAERFDAMLLHVAGGNTAIAVYLLTVLGYAALFGHNREQKFFYLHGPSGSGKSALLEAVSAVMGPLAHNSTTDLISVMRNGRNARTEYSLLGARIVTITESSGFISTDEGQLKRLTGETWISVNRHYSKTELRMRVTFTIINSTNNMPMLGGADAAVARRLVVIPCGAAVAEEYQVKGLGEIIGKEEAEGILARLVWGAQQYLRYGLRPPAEVVMETARYLASQSSLENWMAECCSVQRGWNPGGTPLSVSSVDAWRSYRAWKAGSPGLNKHLFMDQLRAHPAVAWNDTSRRFEGIVLTAAARAAIEDE